MIDGTPVQDEIVWRTKRRVELLDLFSRFEYGRSPSAPSMSKGTLLRLEEGALGGVATRKEVRVSVGHQPDAPAFTLLIYLPNKRRHQNLSSPIFVGLNFFGNHTICNDGGITLTRSWIPVNSITKGRSAEQLRGVQSSSWPIDLILESGYGVATVHCGEIVPDSPAMLRSGICDWFCERGFGDDDEAWGAIGGWAWGLSRAVDHLYNDPDVDPARIIAVGHSRLGKAALWAGAQDERFAMVVSNNSGRGGAALAMRKFGERVADINAAFPHWFCRRFRTFSHREELLPMDQHELLALIAPRPIYVASAQLDLAADPRGEFLATEYAKRVYAWMRGETGTAHRLKENNESCAVGYHMREGRHGITAYDWAHFISFANLHFSEN